MMSLIPNINLFYFQQAMYYHKHNYYTLFPNYVKRTYTFLINFKFIVFGYKMPLLYIICLKLKINILNTNDI